MHSCLYEGFVSHRRHAPLTHAFRYKVCMVWLDLNEASDLVGPRCVIPSRRFATHSFLSRDHLYDPATPLQEQVRALVKRQAGRCSAGPIRLLTQLRCCGYYFSPLNLFYVYDEQDTHPAHVVAEVSNTPWNERQYYVLSADANQPPGRPIHSRHAKQMHVSPFMPMDLQYVWQLPSPGRRLSVRLGCDQGPRRLFDATMSLNRVELTRASLRRMALRYPWMTGRIMLAIHYQALKLWWKRCPFFPHPSKSKRSSGPDPTPSPPQN